MRGTGGYKSDQDTQLSPELWLRTEDQSANTGFFRACVVNQGIEHRNYVDLPHEGSNFRLNCKTRKGAHFDASLDPTCVARTFDCNLSSFFP